jgi:hypothetical protein
VTAEEIKALAKAAGISVSPLGLISAADTARLLQRSNRTIRSWRSEGRGPAHTQLGGRFWYSCEALAIYWSVK